nr:MAG: aminoglycoside phosphotransferase [Hyphomicrobiales bacterium]
MTDAESARKEAMQSFLREAGWQDAMHEPLAGDASTRRYIRVAKNGHSAMLMDQPQQAEAPTADADASPAERRRLGYNAVARLAGANCARFVAVAAHLRSTGLAAPEIIAADTENGFLLLEDFGDNLYTSAIASGADEKELYGNAIDALVNLHENPAPAALGRFALFAYDETALLAEIDLLTEWFFPEILGRPASADEEIEHRGLWQKALATVPDTPPVFVHRDYHAQNLIWMPRRSGVARVGMVDFQDAVAGHPAYDVISLLEDARRDVSPELAGAMTAHYLAASRFRSDPEDFLAAAAIFAAQRNAKIIGIFARLAKRDRKPFYLSHLPRVWRYMAHDLEAPALKNLKAWYERVVPADARIGISCDRGERG